MFKDAELTEMIYSEFDCYQWHQCQVGYRGNNGWNRIMVHSLVQQLVRQYPVQYAVYVALRPDHRIALVSYPCCAMYTLPGELLVHAYDMGLKQMITEGKEKNLL